MGKRGDLGQPEGSIGNVHAGRDQFRRITMPPGCRIEVVADLDTPAGVERVVVQTTPADDPAIGLADDGPGSIAVAAAEPLVHRDPTAAVPQRCVDMGEAHRLRIAQEPEQRRHIGTASAGTGAAAVSVSRSGSDQGSPRSMSRSAASMSSLRQPPRIVQLGHDAAHEGFRQRQGALRIAEVIGEQRQRQLPRAVAFVGPFESHAAEPMDVEARIERHAIHRHHRTVETAAALIHLHAKLTTLRASRYRAASGHRKRRRLRTTAPPAHHGAGGQGDERASRCAVAVLPRTRRIVASIMAITSA